MISESDRIEKKVQLQAPIERVWRAVSDATEFGRWFGVKFDGPFVAHTLVTGRMRTTEFDANVAKAQEPYAGMKFEFSVERIEAPRLISFRWHPFAIDPSVDYSHEPTTLIVFELTAQADGTLLTITESGFDQIPLERRAKAFTKNSEGWNMQVQLIANYLADAP
jgi:uncharacterized protein YndB with AHSA1/START domain